MQRRFTLLAVVLSLFAPAAIAQGTRPRTVQQRPAASVGAPQPKPSTAAAPLSFATIPFAAGETLSYNVDWNNNGTAATVVLRVGDKKTYYGNESVPLSADVATVGMVRFIANVQVHYASYSSPRTILPFRTESEQSINGKSENTSIVFDRSKNVAVVGTATTPITPDTGDMLTLLYRLRAMPLKVGDTATIEGFDGKRKFQVKSVVEAKEPLEGGARRSEALRVALLPIRNGEPDDSMRIRVWYSTDASRVPVLITAEPDFGSIRMTLAKASGVAN